jgi:CelD/BcsL family acetyltransferase involved in cellulose biosynthesis
MDIEILRGDAVIGALEDPAFQQAWDRLYDQCPWATVFQRLTYVSAWYRCYQQINEPVIVSARSGGKIVALFPLAVDARSRRLVYAGAHQSEYQAWLAEPSIASDFLVETIRAVRRAFPGHPLYMKYIPPGVPLDACRGRRGNRRYCSVVTHTRQLWKFSLPDADAAAEQHDTSKRKLKALQKLGPLEFKRLATVEEFERVLPEIELQYDLRMGALYDTTPFRTDTAKDPFHRELFRVPGLLHVTTLAVGGRLVSAQVALCSRDTVHLGFWSQSPFMLRHSPGKLHLNMLGALVKNEGWDALDLTPGAASYKDRYAVVQEEVFELTAHAGRRAFLAARCRDAAESAARSALRSARLEPAKVKAFVSALPGRLKAMAGRAPDAGAARNAGIAMWTETARARNLADVGGEGRDRLADLLLYPEHGTGPRQELLSPAQDRFARGDHSWTVTEGGVLQWCGWFGDRKAGASLADVAPGSPALTLPVNAVVCYDLRPTLPDGGDEAYTKRVRETLAAAARSSAAPRIYVCVSEDDVRCRRTLEALGWTVDTPVASDARAADALDQPAA